MIGLKNDKGITLIVLIITIIVLLILAGVVIVGGISGTDNSIENRAESELNEVHHALIERYTKYQLTKDKSLLVGTMIDLSSLTDVPNSITWKVTQFTSVNDSDIKNPDRKYYRLNKSDLEKLGLKGDYNNSSYIVNYYSGEAYDETNKTTSKGIVLYKSTLDYEASEFGDEFIRDGLLAHYDAINNTGNGHSSTTTTWKDLSGNDKNGKMTDVTLGRSYAQFNGTTSWVNNGIINDFTNKFTLDATIRISEIQGQQHDIICNMETGGLCLRLYDGKPEAFFYSTEQDYIGIQSSETVSLNSINNIVVSYDGNNIKLYVNGKEDEDAILLNRSRHIISSNEFLNQTIKSPQSNTVMALGTNPEGANSKMEFFKGDIYNAKIYNEGLSANEIKHNYIIDKIRYNIEE